jgi:glycosyltransferase involved in cell wall biosynthesis
MDFAVIQDDMIAFLDADKTRKLVVLGHFDKNLLPGELRDQVEMHPFSTYDHYLHNLAMVDCAVMPLTDDAFNRCKSAVRVIDASAVSVPSLVGTVSDMANFVQDGQTGHVIGEGGSWLDALEGLARDPKQTRAMGKTARQVLQSEWCARLDPPVLDREVLDWVRG